MLVLVLICSGCASSKDGKLSTSNSSSDTNSSSDKGDPYGNRPETCPETRQAQSFLPSVKEEHLKLEYWRKQWEENLENVDAVLLSAEEIRTHNFALNHPIDGTELKATKGQFDLLIAPENSKISRMIEGRLRAVAENLKQGIYFKNNADAVDQKWAQSILSIDVNFLKFELQKRVAFDFIELQCAPIPLKFYKKGANQKIDVRFDRNLCSTIRPQEPFEIIAAWPDSDFYLVRTPYALGWIDRKNQQSAPLENEIFKKFLFGEKIKVAKSQIHEELNSDSFMLDEETWLPLVNKQNKTVGVVTSSGVKTFRVIHPEKTLSNFRALTRRAFFAEAFSHLDTAYGWGGYKKGKDCSRFLMSVFDTFNLKLPRNSYSQSQVGSFMVDVGDLDDATKTQTIEEANKHGIVVLFMPGHIMLYLGRDTNGTPMALHSFAEYLELCPSEESLPKVPLKDRQTLVEVHKLTVSDLELGRGTTKRSFLERITKIVVFGKPPGFSLEGVAKERLPAAPEWDFENHCKDSTENAVFVSPEKPILGEETRIIFTAEKRPGPLSLKVFEKNGPSFPLKTEKLGGPPYSAFSTIKFEKPGSYYAVFGDGKKTLACQRIKVRKYPPKPSLRKDETAPYWNARWRWEQDTENFYSAFVEQLFKEPLDEDITWPNLQALIQDENRNLLFNHFGMNEDEELDLGPDCADLPYYLRAYFAWKLSLPFGYRRCSRGKANRPPFCVEFLHNQMPVDEKKAEKIQNDEEAFKYFLFKVRNSVHSASARTVPGDSSTDLYPIDLTRDELRPGIVFADPYGHLLVIASWKPQTFDNYGVLIGADAQPDKTVGRRRFWRGSFLFTPSIKNVGAGFKAWRPVVFNKKDNLVTTLENSKLKRTPFEFSNFQYEMSKEQFYDRMFELINPRPLDPKAMLLSLVDALEESVLRRVNSIENGRKFLEEHSGKIIEMPEGASIFLTTGDWENFSTPSRDMRLLISMDAVLQFPSKLESSPAQFGISNLEEAKKEKMLLEETLTSELSKRTFQYVRSDGSTFTLSLHKLRERKSEMEMAYNPNDCPEIRWGAPQESEEMRTCTRRAPPSQKEKMRQYRPWFQNRERPVR